MNTYMYIGPEDCGKTSMAVNLFTASRPGTVKFITTSKEVIRLRGELKNELSSNTYMNILTYKSLPSLDEFAKFTDDITYPAIIIDNFFKFDLTHRINLYKTLHSLKNPFDLHVFCTPQKLYDIKVLEDIRQLKTENKLISTIASSTSENIQDLFYNFITDDEVDVINLSRPIKNDDLEKYKSDPETLLTKGVGIYEKRRN